MLEGEGWVTVRPRLLQPDRQTGGQTDRDGQKGGRKGELSLTIRQTDNQIDELMKRKSD